LAKSSQTNAAKQSAKPVSKGKVLAGKKVKKVRGGLLTFLLVVIFLHGTLASLLAYSSLKQEYTSSSTWVLAVLSLISLACIIAAVGMWFWKRWAIYLYTAACAIAGGVHLILTGSGLVMIYDMIPVAILAYVINLQNKQNLFE
jgi:hypothetical protein